MDLGANIGDTVAKFLEWHPSHSLHAFEPNPDLYPELKRRFQNEPRVSLLDRAAWIRDEEIRMYLGHPLSSTVMQGKKSMPQAPIYEINYSRSVQVQAVDFSRWLRRNVTSDDEVTVKMDIEGAEYPVLGRLLETGAVELIHTLICEFHQDRYPVSRKTHNDLINELTKRTRLIHWH